MKDNQSFVKAMSKTGDKVVLFSDEILKVNKKFNFQYINIYFL